MSPILTQGLFHVIYTVSFFALGISLLFQSRKTHSLIAKALGLSFFGAGVEYSFITTAILLFHDNQLMYQILSAVIGITLAMISIAFAVPVISYIFPRVSVKPFIFIMGILTVVMALQNIFDYTPATLTGIGTMEIGGPKWQIMCISLMLMLIFVPMGIGFIYKTFKARQYLKGTLLGLGLMVATLFLPMTYQVTSFDTYVFFSTLTSIGFMLLVAGLVVHPLLKPQRQQRRG